MRPPLPNPREEAFARARARGLDPAAAWRAAGGDDEEEAGRVNKLMRVMDRIEAIKATRDTARGADLANTVAGLLAIAHGWQRGRPGVEMRESRLAWLDAHRLWQAHESREALAGAPVPPGLDEPDLDEDAWIERYGANRAELPADAP